MEIRYSKKDIDFWLKSGNKSILKKISELIKAIGSNPYEGIGKPEALKYDLTRYWSRRIDTEHRIIYEIIDENTIDILSIISLKVHYE
jgi:toxin YoeB